MKDKYQTCVICDFGLSKSYENSVMKTHCGTTNYMAPEIQMNNSKYTPAVDIWALGCCFYELLQLQSGSKNIAMAILHNGKKFFNDFDVEMEAKYPESAKFCCSVTILAM